MGDFTKVIKGVGWFLFGFIYTVVTAYIVPPMIEIVADIGGADGTFSSTLVAIVWIGLISTWILSVIVMPAYYIVEGMKA